MYVTLQLLQEDVAVVDLARIQELAHVQNSMGVSSHMCTRTVEGKNPLEKYSIDSLTVIGI